MKKKTIHQIIDETVEFYSKNPRSKKVIKGALECVYRGSGNKECAFARLVAEEFKPWLIEGKVASVQIELLGKFIIKSEYQVKLKDDNAKEFYDALQRLHDVDRYWADEGLSEDGKDYVVRIKNTFSTQS